MAVAQFASVFGALLLIEGLVLALIPQRLAMHSAAVAAPFAIMAYGAFAYAIGYAVIAIRLLHVTRLSVTLALFWSGSMLWMGIIPGALERSLLEGLLILGLIVGGFVAPFLARFDAKQDTLIKNEPNALGDLAELAIGLAIFSQGLAVVVLGDSRGLLPALPIPPALLGIVGMGAGIGLAFARLFLWKPWVRLLSGVVCGLLLFGLSAHLVVVGQWGTGIIALILGAVAARSAFYVGRVPVMFGPVTLRNRAAVLLGLPAGWLMFMVALLASVVMDSLVRPETAATVAVGKDILFVIVLMAYLVFASLAVVASRQVGRELAIFGQTIGTIAGGKFDEPLPAPRGDERDMVLHAFQVMRARMGAQLEQLERNANRMLKLQQATLQLTSGIEERALAERALVHALDLLQADTGSIWLRAPATSQWRLVAIRGNVPAARRLVTELEGRLAMHFVGRASAHDEPLIVSPLTFRGHESNGAIALMRRGDAAPPFQDDEVLVLDLFAGFIANAVHAGRLGMQLGRMEGQRETERMKAEFLASVSHELRTPLTMIHGYAELLRDREFERAQVQRIGADVMGASSSLTRMVDDLLDYSRLAAGRFTLTRTTVDINEVVNEAVGMFRQQLAGQQAILVELPLNPPPLVADGDRVRQAVANLVSNALKYGPENGLVRVQTTFDAFAVRVSVRDEGPGVTDDERERVFERFYRSIVHTNSTVHGVGIGLSVVRAVVEAHGGSVGVDAGPTGGSLFWISLPLDYDYSLVEGGSPS